MTAGLGCGFLTALLPAPVSQAVHGVSPGPPCFLGASQTRDNLWGVPACRPYRRHPPGGSRRPASLRADAVRGTLPDHRSSLCPPQMGERVAGRLQPAPKAGMVGCCPVPKVLQPLGACTGLGRPLQRCSGGTGLVLVVVVVVGSSRGAGGCRADGCALPAGRASLHDKASLRIEQVRSEDQGWYECKVLMLDQQYDTFHNGSWVHLTVNGEPGAAGRGGLRHRRGVACGAETGFPLISDGRRTSAGSAPCR